MSFDNNEMDIPDDGDEMPQDTRLNKNLKKDYLCVIYIGRKGSGKTYLLMKKLKKYNKKKTIITLISPTAKLQDMYQENAHLFDKYYSTVDETIIQEIIHERTKNPDKEAIVVFDDIGSVPYFKREKTELQTLINNCRHHKIHVIFLLQRMTQATTTTRDNTDLVFCFKLWSVREIDMFRETFFGLMSKEDFAKFSYRAWNPPDGDMYSYITALRVGAEFRFGIKDQLFPKFEGRQDSLNPVAPNLLNQKTVAPVLLNKKPVVPKGKVAKKKLKKKYRDAEYRSSEDDEYYGSSDENANPEMYEDVRRSSNIDRPPPLTTQRFMAALAELKKKK